LFNSTKSTFANIIFIAFNHLKKGGNRSRHRFTNY